MRGSSDGRLSRRSALGAVLGAAGVAVLGRSEASAASVAPGRLRQSVSRWPYAKIPLPEFARAVKEMGLDAIDLLQPEEWPVVRDAGLKCSLGYPTPRRDFIQQGFNDPANHPKLIGELEATVPKAKAAGVPTLIAMFGNRMGRSDADAIKNCVDGLRRVAPLMEEQGITLAVELLNSKVDHKDYQGDHTWFGSEVIKGVGSPRVKLLYDIYHMQIMEGDVIRTIRAHIAEIAHFHTGGVPGRHELDDTQELNWHAVARAIADTGFDGYIAHEFVPTRDPLTSLKEAVATCTV
jgi:hydroxypyruvate isomerase